MNILKNKQQGVANLALVSFLAVILALSFAGMRVVNNRSDESSSTSESSGPESAENLKNDSSEEDELEAVEEPDSIDQPSSSDTRTIDFVKGGGDESSGGIVHVSGTMSEASSGTCTYKFSLNGTVRVETTTSITNSKTCVTDISDTEFPKSSTYDFTIDYISNDGLIEAHQAAHPYTVFN